MNEADKHLLSLVRDGDQEGWSQFVARFQLRLLAYATRQVGHVTTSEDLVQETFLGFLQSIEEYREQCELESFLFQILRRRIVDHYRRQGQNRELPACEFRVAANDSAALDPIENAPSSELSPSVYIRRDEQRRQDELTLAFAVERLAVELHVAEKFRDLKIAEGLFYARRRAVDLATVLSISENDIAVVKRRLIERLASFIRQAGEPSSKTAEMASDLLSTVWETTRPSCPKRTTLGKYTLGILPLDWDDFVRFHVDTLGCTFCNANLAELQTTSESSENAIQHYKIFNSTIGFLTRR